MIKAIKFLFSKKSNKSLSNDLKLKKKVFFYWKFFRIICISYLLIILSFFKFFDTNKNLEEKIEKELDKLDYNPTPLNWNNVKKGFKLLVNKYKHLIKNEKNIEEDSPIWVMWYQGIENAPPIVKSCIQSIIINRAKHPVYIISKYNLDKYIKLPPYIIEKFEKREFSIQQFSDIIRFALLCKHGGYWIDSTYFINTPLTKVDTNFYTLKLKQCWLRNHPFIKCFFSGNFLAVSKNSFIATYGYMAFLYYWKKYNSLISYFLIDYIIHIAYINVPEFNNIITNLPSINCSIFRLEKILKSDFQYSDFKCSFNKLSKRVAKQAFNGKNITNYGYIIEKYKLETKNSNINYTLNI